MSDTATTIIAEGYTPETIEGLLEWPLCQACEQLIRDGDKIYVLYREMYPWLSEDDDDQELEVIEWHVNCDKGSASAREAWPPS